MDKKNSKHLKANKNNMENVNSRVEFAEDIDSSKKANKHNSNKHSNCNSYK